MPGMDIIKYGQWANNGQRRAAFTKKDISRGFSFASLGRFDDKNVLSMRAKRVRLTKPKPANFECERVLPLKATCDQRSHVQRHRRGVFRGGGGVGASWD